MKLRTCQSCNQFTITTVIFSLSVYTVDNDDWGRGEERRGEERRGGKRRGGEGREEEGRGEGANSFVLTSEQLDLHALLLQV